MKNIADYITNKISESNIDMNKLFYAVANWFGKHYVEANYDSRGEWLKTLKYISIKENDFVTDECIKEISDEFPEAKDYYDEIENKLVELAKDAL